MFSVVANEDDDDDDPDPMEAGPETLVSGIYTHVLGVRTFTDRSQMFKSGVYQRNMLDPVCLIFSKSQYFDLIVVRNIPQGNISMRIF